MSPYSKVRLKIKRKRAPLNLFLFENLFEGTALLTVSYLVLSTLLRVAEGWHYECVQGITHVSIMLFGLGAIALGLARMLSSMRRETEYLRELM